MSLISNLVQQTTTSAGTGNLTLAAANGRQSFYAAFGAGGSDMFFYFISHRAAPEWEAGTGHMSDAVTLVRDTVIASSNAAAPVDFSSGEKDVVNDVEAGRQAVLPLDISAVTGLQAALDSKADSASLGTLAAQSGTFSGTSSGTNTGDQDLSGLVPKTTTVNGHALSANVSVTASDLALAPVATSGAYSDLSGKPSLSGYQTIANTALSPMTGGYAACALQAANSVSTPTPFNFTNTGTGAGFTLGATPSITSHTLGYAQGSTGSTSSGSFYYGSRIGGSARLSLAYAGNTIRVSTLFKIDTLPAAGGEDYVFVGPHVTDVADNAPDPRSNNQIAGLVLSSDDLTFQLAKRISTTYTKVDTGVTAQTGVWYNAVLEIITAAASANVVCNLYIGLEGAAPALVATTTGVGTSSSWGWGNFWAKKINGTTARLFYMAAAAIAIREA